MPYCRIRLQGNKPDPRGYLAEPRTFADHMLKRRLDERLLQRELAARVRVDVTTIRNWESGRTLPSIRQFPAVIEFLGYDPLITDDSRGERLLAYRRRVGLSRAEMARRLGVDPTTLWRWEAGRTPSAPSERAEAKLSEIAMVGCSRSLRRSAMARLQRAVTSR